MLRIREVWVRFHHSESRNLAAVSRLAVGLRLELGRARLKVYHESKSLAILAFLSEHEEMHLTMNFSAAEMAEAAHLTASVMLPVQYVSPCLNTIMPGDPATSLTRYLPFSGIVPVGGKPGIYRSQVREA